MSLILAIDLGKYNSVLCGFDILGGETVVRAG